MTNSQESGKKKGGGTPPPPEARTSEGIVARIMYRSGVELRHVV